MSKYTQYVEAEKQAAVLKPVLDVLDNGLYIQIHGEGGLRIAQVAGGIAEEITMTPASFRTFIAWLKDILDER